jgi:hypothetical protein
MAREKSRKHRHDQRMDDTIEDSFPASDPPSFSAITGVGKPRHHHERTRRTERVPSHQRGAHERPTGHPTWDRHATETAHSWEDEDQSRT